MYSFPIHGVFKKEIKFKKQIIMHQLIKLIDAISLLQLAISSLFIHALGDLSQALTGI